MEKSDNTYLNTEKVIIGIGKAVAMIEGSYGAAGGNVVVEQMLPPNHIITNDGKAIVDAIKLADPVENIGANIIKEAGNKADKDSGDGRKTTMLLTKAIFEEAAKSKELPMTIYNSLKEALPVVLESLEKQKREITVEQVGAVATISSENEEIGKMIQEIYQEIGKDGIIEVDNSNLPETFFEVTEGVRLRNAKCFGQYSYTEPGKAVYKNPKILISRERITSTDQLDNILATLVANGINELVIYCDDIDLSVASKLALTHLNGGFKTLIIKAPTLWKDWLFEDFAKITGATIVDNKEGKTFKNFTLNDLGSCSKIISDGDETRVIGIKDISEHLEYLNNLGTDEGKLRATWLQTKVAVLRVGAQTESELSYKSKKARDACAAAYLALKGGVLPGGGVSLLNAKRDLKQSDVSELKIELGSGKETKPNMIGLNILYKALEIPFNTICNNAGVRVHYELQDEDFNKGELPESIDANLLHGNMGFNSKSRAIVSDVFEAGIIDPFIVVENAVKNAVSLAGTVLTLKGAIILDRDETTQQMRRM